jgi:hypothetical protein
VTSYINASTLVVRCLPKNFSRTTIGFHKRRKVAGDKLRKRIKSHKAPSYNNREKQANLYVTRVGVRGFKAPSDTNKSLPIGYRSKATNKSKSQPLCEPTAPHVSCDTTKVYHFLRGKL